MSIGIALESLSGVQYVRALDAVWAVFVGGEPASGAWPCALRGSSPAAVMRSATAKNKRLQLIFILFSPLLENLEILSL
jgi:hypothetical protein